MDIDRISSELKKIDPREGIPEALFVAISSVVPIPNVDLMILDGGGRILLSWRDDKYYGKGWHLPGGCIRFKESMIERVHKTAVSELESEVIVDTNPIAVKDAILNKNELEPRLRAHHVAILYKCTLVDKNRVEKQSKKEGEAGYLRWFDSIPENILGIHSCYDDVFREYELLS